MTPHLNSLGQPIGPSLPNWQPPAFPAREIITGRFCQLEPLDPGRHGAHLHRAFAADPDPRLWTYLPYGPFANFDEFAQWLQAQARTDDPRFYAIIDPSNHQPTGLASYLRITPAVGSIEVGHLLYSAGLRRTPAATEAMHLMMARAFRLGYRRYEWKCDALNEPSRAAARRLGFAFEGLFRQAIIYKGRSRDTAWYSVIDRDWPELDAIFRRWLDPSNFDDHGRQRSPLSEWTAPLRLRDPSLPTEPQ